MLIALAAAPDLLRLLAPWSEAGEPPFFPRTAYLLKAEATGRLGAVSRMTGSLCSSKSPDRGGWDIADLEEHVRAAIVACGGATSAERITPRLPREPSGAGSKGGV